MNRWHQVAIYPIIFIYLPFSSREERDAFQSLEMDGCNCANSSRCFIMSMHRVCIMIHVTGAPTIRSTGECWDHAPSASSLRGRPREEGNNTGDESWCLIHRRHSLQIFNSVKTVWIVSTGSLMSRRNVFIERVYAQFPPPFLFLDFCRLRYFSLSGRKQKGWMQQRQVLLFSSFALCTVMSLLQVYLNDREAEIKVNKKIFLEAYLSQCPTITAAKPRQSSVPFTWKEK